jgi:hypothetical protein
VFGQANNSLLGKLKQSKIVSILFCFCGSQVILSQLGSGKFNNFSKCLLQRGRD